MASINQKGKIFYVVYRYKNELGVTKQKWESGCNTYKDALKRKIEVENLLSAGIVPEQYQSTVAVFINKWLPMHAKNNWQFRTYSSSAILIKNHILPVIGHHKLSMVTSYQIEKLISDLYGKATANGDGSKTMSTSTVRHVYILLKQIFNKAVEWGYISSSPVKCKPPRIKRKNQDIWSPEVIVSALENIQHPLLHLAVHLAFFCSLREGEILAIKIEDVDFEDGSVMINKTLQRVENKSLSLIPHDSIIQIFPPTIPRSASCLVLKIPKTDSSVRRVYISKALLDEIRMQISHIERNKDFFNWIHNGLLFCHAENGMPIDPRRCLRWLKQWQAEVYDIFEYPHITFHSLRHSSATYKLLLSEGSYKTVQGDTGHKSANTLVNIYAHIQDKNRRTLAIKLEEALYLLQTKRLQ